MTASRMTALGVVALAATALLTGCGGGDSVSPHTAACRAYEIHAGTDQVTVAAVEAVFSDGGDSAALTASADAIAAAATDAGLTKNLSDQDFERYRALAEAARTFASTIGNLDGTQTVAGLVGPVQKALTAVTTSCG